MITQSPPARTGLAARGRSTRRGDGVLLIGGLGLGAGVGLGVLSVKAGIAAPGGKLLAAGTLSALAGTYLCLVLLLLISRVPWLEREIGHDRMVLLHRKVAPYSLVLILGHVVFTTLSYAQAASRGVVAEAWHLVTHSRWMLPATAAFGLMAALGVMSVRAIRRRMRYETWWVAHLYFYIAVALSFGHQVVLGPMFVGHASVRNFWAGLYVVVAATIAYSRVLRPLTTSLRHRLRVAAIVPESDGVLSVYLSGTDLDLLKARGGQFFQWRFLTREWWWQAHPYSLSASPNPAWLRITVKDLGDQSSLLHRLHPGTRVWAEGPYGVFTASARHGETVTAIAAGVGITPIRAVLDDLPHDTAVTVLYRVAKTAAAPLRDELERLVGDRGWTLHYLDGARERHPITAEHLTSLAPDLARSDVYVCGPDAFTGAVRRAVVDAGVDARRVHHEAFSF
ncbi:MAG TPA: ferredoxin reductase family protein [Jatrophihabitans sp.]|jgi:predicted ferric reductase|uniref:ferredoxin reductase family protein n=1 Tax=Jatrophihabitans sp. TaxID=1932789 RepID=UPI002E097134|nr:ferredoxin reductase family protein [Jatrophihabitans sp.]